MQNIERSEVIFSLSDDMYFNPEKYFSDLMLQSMRPYHIFTGVGMLATVENDKYERSTYFFANQKSIKRFAGRNTKQVIVRTDECFYAYIVRQNLNLTGLLINVAE